MLFKHFASKNQQPGFCIKGTLVENELISSSWSFKNLLQIKARFISSSHCVKSVQIRSNFWSVFSRVRSKCRKIWTINYSVFGHFSRTVNRQDFCSIKPFVPSAPSLYLLKTSENQKVNVKMVFESLSKILNQILIQVW